MSQATSLRMLEMESPVGRLTLVASSEALVGLFFGRPTGRLAGAIRGTSALLERAKGELAEYFAGEREGFDLPVDPPGTEFQKAVWEALRGIRFGTTCAYRDVAERVGQPGAVRAVGRANGQNPIAIVIPCHRVIGADGSLTGYGGGLPVKRWLLAHEAAQRELFDAQVAPGREG